jgi:hypothetical protein
MNRIMLYDHFLDWNDIFKFVYCSMILFLIYHSVDQNDILKFIYYSMIIFFYMFKYFFTISTL